MNLEFFGLFVLFLFGLLLSLLISLASYFLGEKTPDREKVSVYECGFDPIDAPGEPFSVRFFLIAILFLVFDLEISFLFPWSVSLSALSLFGHAAVLVFLAVLTLGLVYEWAKGGLEWE